MKMYIGKYDYLNNSSLLFLLSYFTRNSNFFVYKAIDRNKVIDEKLIHITDEIFDVIFSFDDNKYLDTCGQYYVSLKKL